MSSEIGERPGHPLVRQWMERHPDAALHQRDIDPAIQNLTRQLGLGGVVRDLGGADNLTLLVDDGRHVLRSYKPFVTKERVIELQRLRRMVVDAGLATPVPVSINGQSVFPCGGRWAEVEPFIKLPLAASPIALFTGLGRLHRALASQQRPSTADLRPSFVSVEVLRSWVAINRDDGFLDARHARELRALVDRIEQRWTPAEVLPIQLIHGDPHAGNILHCDVDPTTGHLYLDFGGVELAPRAHDLAMAIVYQLVRFGSRVTDASGDVAAWLDAYSRAARVGVSRQEREAIPVYGAAVTAYYDICGWGDGWRSLGNELLGLFADR